MEHRSEQKGQRTPGGEKWSEALPSHVEVDETTPRCGHHHPDVS